MHGEQPAWWARLAGAGRGRAHDRRRPRRQKERRRLDALAEATGPLPQPVGWSAGVGSHLLAVLCCVNLALITASSVHLYEVSLSGTPRLVFGAMLVATWLHFACSLANWSLAAGRSGVWVRNAWGTRFLSWQDFTRVKSVYLGAVVVGDGDGDRDRTVGRFLPGLLSRLLRRPDEARRAADLLTLMKRHPELRPPQDSSPADLAPSRRRWVVLLAAALLGVAVLWSGR
ncbi:hypothetical protein QNO07_24080 [Streptomyces sp. 549]|uniref:hypothetical protein n=1 Tax=Streptomyces sp. 549 TaxID=3049076 RepID=UPI0024C44391|nr:hypothetical protein [Streptomyces sp. 549]MDK1476451.1 hypothetical protein [Streptomyces sp. 549]